MEKLVKARAQAAADVLERNKNIRFDAGHNARVKERIASLSKEAAENALERRNGNILLACRDLNLVFLKLDRAGGPIPDSERTIKEFRGAFPELVARHIKRD